MLRKATNEFLCDANIDGKVEVYKERLKIDEENKTTAAEAIDGDCMKHYKNYKATLQVISRGDSSFAKCTIDHEKLNDNKPSPTKNLDWLVQGLIYMLVGEHLDICCSKKIYSKKIPIL